MLNIQNWYLQELISKYKNKQKSLTLTLPTVTFCFQSFEMVKKNVKKTHSNSKASKQSGGTGSRTGSGNSSGGKTRKKTSGSADKSKETNGAHTTPPVTAGQSNGTAGVALTNGVSHPAEASEERPSTPNREEVESLRQLEVAERVQKVLHGRTENLPPLCSKIVRIFTSSTFTGRINK